MKTVKINDIFYSTWGYEQTNICFYQVIKVTPKTATIIQLKSKNEMTGYMSGIATPIIGDFKNDEKITRKLKCYRQDGTPSIVIDSVEIANLWDGKPEQFTCYA